MRKEEISGNYMEEQLEIHGKKELRDKSKRFAIVTGVGRNNIGYAIAGRLANEMIVTRIEERNYDLSNQDHVLHMLKQNNAADTLVLCHGYTHLDWLENQRVTEIQKMIAVNLTSHINLVTGFVREQIDKNHKKTIVIIGSMAANAVLNGSSAYCAAKAGLQHFVKCAAWELAPKGFDVFLINPSNVEDSPMSDQTIRDLMRYRGLNHSDAVDYWSAGNPRSQFLSKDEIAEVAHHLAMGQFPYLSGTPINLTGGQR